MKIFIMSVMLTLFSVCCLHAAERYEVECSTYLNVRAGKSTSSDILGVLDNGETITVHSIDGDWAEIEYKGRRAYVSSAYIVSPGNESSGADKGRGNVKGMFSNAVDALQNMSFGGNTKWMVFLILPLIGIAYLFQKKLDGGFRKSHVYGLAIFLSLLSVAEIIYMFGDQSFIWFCQDPRWWWIAVNFCIFAVATFGQIMSYITFAGFISNGNLKIGLYSWPAGLVLGIILSLFMDEYVTIINFGLVALAQLIQAVIIFVTVFRHIGFIHALVFSVVYLVSTAATAVVLGQFIYLLIIVMLVVFVLQGLSSSSGRSSGSQSYESSGDSSGYNPDDDYVGTIKDENGYERKLKDTGFGTYQDDKGDRWKDSGWGSVERDD